MSCQHDNNGRRSLLLTIPIYNWIESVKFFDYSKQLTTELHFLWGVICIGTWVLFTLRELGFINLRRDQHENLCSTEINALHKLSCPRVVRVGLNCPPIKSLQVQNCHIDSNHDLTIACFRAGLVSTTLDLPVLASDAWGKIKSLISIEWKWQLANLRVGTNQKKYAEKAVSASKFGWCAASAVGTFGYHNKFTGSNLSNMSLLYLHIFLDRNRHPVGFLLPFLHYVWTNSAS